MPIVFLLRLLIFDTSDKHAKMVSLHSDLIFLGINDKFNIKCKSTILNYKYREIAERFLVIYVIFEIIENILLVVYVTVNNTKILVNDVIFEFDEF